MQIKTLNVDNLTREQIRSKILKTWEAESIGSGQYRYNVEQCKDGSLIYLLRPAPLNKGCDFMILSENFKKWKNGNDKAPKHNDVIELLQQILHDDIILKADLISAIGRIYNCENLDRVLSDYPRLLATADCKAERALKLLKWMWIEQDITYWTGEGRQMLKKGVDEFLKNT
ncbi:MAG: hypothetical protein WA277_10670 [Nitrospirota bacterium]